MDLCTSSNHPWNIKIDGIEYTVERLNMGDLAGISQSMKEERQEEVAFEYNRKLDAAAPEKRPELEREMINAWAAAEGPGPAELIGWLLTTMQGMTTALTVALHKKHPGVPAAMIVNLAWSDALLETVYEIVGHKLKVVKKTDQAKGDQPPFPKKPREGTG